MSAEPGEALTTLLHRVKAGDSCARDELFRSAQARLELLTRRMLRRYPTVQRWADTDDVFQGAALRLSRALDTVSIKDTRGFFNFAAAVLRRERIDLARHYYGPEGLGANHHSVSPDDANGLAEGVARNPEFAHLERWAAFHSAVETLPVEEREVVGLIFYHGWDQETIAQQFGVSDRTVRRWWQSACMRLREQLGSDLPGE